MHIRFTALLLCLALPCLAVLSESDLEPQELKFPVPAAPGSRAKKIKAQPRTPDPSESFDFPEHLSARSVKEDAALKKKAVRAIARRFGMSGAKAVFLASFQGPQPPEKGYLYWGVAGKIKGAWKIWQAGMAGELRDGKALADPNQFQK